MSGPLVSVITIFLNAERFMKEAIESIRAQTYENWELLLVDDGSSDGGTEIALKYSREHPARIRYLEHEGHRILGISCSRNLGISQAKGEYISLLDADDVWVPAKLEEQVEILERNPEAGMVYGRTLYWFSWTGKPDDLKGDFVEELGVQGDCLYRPPSLLFLNYPFGKAPSPCLCSLLLRRQVVELVGGFVAGFPNMYEDHPFLVKLYLKTSVFVSGECWDKYRIRADSSVGIGFSTGQYERTRLLFLNWFEKYLTEQGMVDTAAWRVLQNALWPYRNPSWSKLLKVLSFPVSLPAALLRKLLPAQKYRKLRNRWLILRSSRFQVQRDS